MTRRLAVAVLVVAALSSAAWGAERYAVTGMVLRVDPAGGTFVASIERIPGFMEAMSMPFSVRDAKELAGVEPGAVIEFTLVVEKDASYAEGIRVRPYQGLEADPLAARRLALFTRLTKKPVAAVVAIGSRVPDFTLIDSQRRPVTLSNLRGRVVGINFMYTACQLPDFCVRVVNHFSVIQQRFRGRLGRDLELLTVTFDPARDQPDVLARYARQWKPDPAHWRFLTGPVADVQRVLGLFGVAAFPNEGLMDHSLHTVFIDRDGTLAANIEGNQSSSDQLIDLARSVLDGK